MIKTERLLLRTPHAGDTDRLTAILSEPEVARWWPGFDRARVAAELIEPHEDPIVFAVEHGGAAIGVIQFGEDADLQYRHASIDIFLSRSAWGRGLAGEAIGALVDHLIDARGHHRIVIDPAASNARAIRAYARVGFRGVGLMKSYERGADGTWHDGLLTELLASDRRPEARRARGPIPEVTVRAADRADADEVLAMMIPFNVLEEIALTPDQLRTSLLRLIDDPSLGFAFITSSGGRTIGYGVLTFGYDLEFGGRDAFLTELYLNPAERGRSFGRSALAAIEAEAKRQGANAVHLMVRPENAAALNLYTGSGYEAPPRILLTKRLG